MCSKPIQMNNYTIRNASSVEEVKTAVTRSAVDREEWSIGMDDHELLLLGLFICMRKVDFNVLGLITN